MRAHRHQICASQRDSSECVPRLCPVSPKKAMAWVVGGDFEFKRLVGGPGFEPGASRSRTGTTVRPSVSRRFLACPPVLNRRARRVLSSPPVSSRVLLVPELRDTVVTSPHD